MAFQSLPLLSALCEAYGRATLAEIADATGLSEHRAVKSLGVLVRRDLVARPERGVYVLTRDGGELLAAASPVTGGPRRSRSGVRRCRDTLRARMWSALRKQRKATLATLLRLACRADENADGTNAAQYMRALAAAGIVRRLEWREPGTALTSPGRPRWLLVRDLGPLAPVWSQRKGYVLDPNNGERLPLTQDTQQEASHD